METNVPKTARYCSFLKPSENITAEYIGMTVALDASLGEPQSSYVCIGEKIHVYLDGEDTPTPARSYTLTAFAHSCDGSCRDAVSYQGPMPEMLELTDALIETAIANGDRPTAIPVRQ